MATNDWKWAELNREQLDQLQEGERTLGADILLAYQHSGTGQVQPGKLTQARLTIAPMTQSQLECLQGLENNIQAVVIAYQTSP